MFLIYNKICKLNHLNISVVYIQEKKTLIMFLFLYVLFLIFYWRHTTVYIELKKLDNIILGN